MHLSYTSAQCVSFIKAHTHPPRAPRKCGGRIFYGSTATEIEAHQRKQSSLFDAIKHGDDEHHKWLKQAIEYHFNDKPVTPVVGKGTKEAEIVRLQALADERGRRISIIDLYMGKDNKRNLCADYPEATKWFDAEGNAK